MDRTAQSAKRFPEGSITEFKIERRVPMGSLVFVAWLKSILMFGLVVLWATASNHCRLEQVPELAFLICADHSDGTPHQEKDCATDGCASVEESLYKTENGQLTVEPAPTAEVATFTIPTLQVMPVPASALTESDSVPALISSCWRFSFRTALPARAPDLAA